MLGLTSSFDGLRMRSSGRSAALMVNPSNREGAPPDRQAYIRVKRSSLPVLPLV